jgi:hypothetical protein
MRSATWSWVSPLVSTTNDAAWWYASLRSSCSCASRAAAAGAAPRPGGAGRGGGRGGAPGAPPRGGGGRRGGGRPGAVRYGRPVRPEEGERFPAFNQRLEQAVARLLDEDQTNWWESLRRAADEGTPSARGPAVAEWRRIWEGSRPLERSDDRRAWRA